MKIHKSRSTPSRERFIAEITEDDLKKYELRFEDIDIYNAKTRNMLCDILLLRESDTPSAFGKAKMDIDVIPDSDGGCIMLISITRPTKYRIIKRKTRDNEKICMLFSAARLYPLAEELMRRGKTVRKNELYYNGEDYAVVVSVSSKSERFFAFLSEYGIVYPPTKLNKAMLGEHYKKLTDDFSKALCS